MAKVFLVVSGREGPSDRWGGGLSVLENCGPFRRWKGSDGIHAAANPEVQGGALPHDRAIGRDAFVHGAGRLVFAQGAPR